MNHPLPPRTFASLVPTSGNASNPAWSHLERSTIAHGSGVLPARSEGLGWAPLHLRALPERTMSSSLQGLHARAVALPCRGVA
jgi:hypothetical protein